jgi:endonuclease I
MKKLSLFALSFVISSFLLAQQTGYYNGTDGKNGEELKEALNDIIQDHTSYSYFFSKEIFKLSDADPQNPSNVIQVYTGFSHDNSDYGNSGLQLNREHVWAKSHGNFTDMPPMYGDVHNLKPSASSVNQDKSNLDFDNGGVQHPVATGCYFSDSTWEPRDEVKGDIARIIFYMSTRYEGENGELDLEVVDKVNTYPLPEHGKLSTLLQWNLQDPPDEFERNRNDVIYSFQQNRNPFIDDPNFAELIWGGMAADLIAIEEIYNIPKTPVANQAIQINAIISNSANEQTFANLYWGYAYDDLNNMVEMTDHGNDDFSCDIPGQEEGTTIYFKIVANDTQNENSSVVYNFYVPKVFSGTITTIYDIQGQQDDSPYEGQVVSTTGVVTANFGDSYFVQDGSGGWNGLFIYESGRNPFVGDSIVLTGEISEYYGKTEMLNITDYYFISSNNALPEPVIVQTGAVSEEHEGVLVKVNNAVCTDDNYQANYYMWTVNDGSGDLRIHNTSLYEFEPLEGSYYSITGPMNYDFDEWKIELSPTFPVSDGGDTDAPVVDDVIPVTSTNVRVLFNEDVEQSSAENIANYSIENVTIETAAQHAFNKTEVNLTVSELSGDYELTVENVEDLFGNVMEPQTIPFSYLGIGELLLNGEVSIYPNPATDQVNVTFTSSKEFSLDIAVYDISGRMLTEESIFAGAGFNSIKLDVNGFGSGLYMIHLSGENGSMMYRLAIE